MCVLEPTVRVLTYLHKKVVGCTMITKKEIRWTLLIAFATLVFLFSFDKLFVTHELSINPHHQTHHNIISVPVTTYSTDAKRTEHTTIPKASVTQSEDKFPFLTYKHLNFTTNVNSVYESNFETFYHISEATKCPAQVEKKYKTSSGGDVGINSLKWCQAMKQKHNVNIGRSWGSLAKNDKQQWDLYKCNELIATGKLQSCNQRWGWDFFSEWLHNSLPIIKGASNITCAKDLKTTIYCQVLFTICIEVIGFIGYRFCTLMNIVYYHPTSL
jgi:hypothetical protein